MKLQRLNFIYLFSVLFIFTFSSCDDWDYSTRRAHLDITPNEWRSNANGNFSFFYDVFNTDITNVNLNRVELLRARLSSSELWIEGRDIWSNDRVRISFEADNQIYQVWLTAGTDSGGSFFYVDERDRNYAVFMERLINRVIRFGHVRLFVEGQFIDAGAINFLLTIKNDIEVDIRQ